MTRHATAALLALLIGAADAAAQEPAAKPAAQPRELSLRARDAAKLAGALLAGADVERVLALHFNVKHRLIGVHVVSVGTLDASLVHPRDVFKAACLSNASGLILAHNHPSGDPTPSGEDRALSDRLRQAGELLGVDLLTTFAARFTPRASEIALDWWVLAFTGVVGSLVAIALAFAPAIPGAALGSGSSLASGGTRVMGSRRFRRLQRGLVIAQVSLSVTLLTAGGLLLRTLLNLYDVDVGADLAQVLTVEVPVVGTGRTSAEVRDVYERIRAEVASLPGVAEAAVGSSVPLRDDFELEIAVQDIAD